MSKMATLKKAFSLVKKLNSKDAADSDRKDAEKLIDSIIGKSKRQKLTKAFTKQEEDKKKQ